MIGTQWLSDRLRKLRFGRRRVSAISPRATRVAVFSWIGVCWILLAVVGFQQFNWIGRVDEYQRESTRRLLDGSARATRDRIRDELGLLLWAFKPPMNHDGATPSAPILDRYLLWHEFSKHGRALKRVLFYDNDKSGINGTRVLLGTPDGVGNTISDDRIALVRDHIDKFGIQFGGLIPARWADTWVIHPESMTIYRPVAKPEPDSRSKSLSARLSGYLILQLDLGFIRDDLLPEILTVQFNDLNRDASHTVTVTLDGKSLYVYEPSNRARSEPRNPRSGVNNYSYRLSQWPGALDRSGIPDIRIEFPLRTFETSRQAVQFGTAQRLRLQSPSDLSRLLNLQHVISSVGPDRQDGSAGVSLQSGAPVSIPRLFLATDGPRRLAVEIRREESSLGQIISQEYRQSLAIGYSRIT